MSMYLVTQRAQNARLDLLASQVIGKITFDEVSPSLFRIVLATLVKIKNLFARMIGKPLVDGTGLTLDEKQARQLMRNVSYILRNKPVEISIQVPLHVQELCSLFSERVSQGNPSITKSEISQIVLKAFKALKDDKNDHEISLSPKQVQQLEISLKLWMSRSDPLKAHPLTYRNAAITLMGLASVFFSISKLFFSSDTSSLSLANPLLNFSNQSLVCIGDKEGISSLSSRLLDLISWKAAPFLALREVSMSQLTTQDVQIRSDISLIKMPALPKSPRYPAPLLPTGVTFKPDFSVSTPVYQDLNRALVLAGNGPTPSINSRLLDLISWKAALFFGLKKADLSLPLVIDRDIGTGLSLPEMSLLTQSPSYTEGNLEMPSQKSRFMHVGLDRQTYFNSST